MLSFESVDLSAPLHQQQTLCTAFSVRSIREHRDAILNGVPNPTLLNQIAATIIQSYWRRYAAKKSVQHLRQQKAQHKVEMARLAEDEDRIVRSQCAVRKHLASRAAKEKAVSRTAELEQQNSHFVMNKGSKVDLPPPNVPPGVAENVIQFETGDYAKECAATAIQAQVRRRLAQNKMKGRARVKSLFLGQFSRRLTSLRKTVSSDGDVPTGRGLEAVFWEASCLLLDPRRPSTSSTPRRPGSATPRTVHDVEPDILVGIHLLHTITMAIRKEDPTRLQELPITLWVTGPLLSQEERTRQTNSILRPNGGGAKKQIVVARTVALPDSSQNSIGLLNTPRYRNTH